MIHQRFHIDNRTSPQTCPNYPTQCSHWISCHRWNIRRSTLPEDFLIQESHNQTCPHRAQTFQKHLYIWSILFFFLFFFLIYSFTIPVWFSFHVLPLNMEALSLMTFGPVALKIRLSLGDHAGNPWRWSHRKFSQKNLC